MIDFPAGEKLARGYLAVPNTGEKLPGVLVLHAWWGLNDFIKQLCDRLAGQGFLALAPDLYAGPVVATVAEAQELVKNMDPEGTRETVLGALDTLLAHPQASPGGVGLVGFSLGAAWAAELSVLRPADVAAVVLFYGVHEADFSQARAVFQGHFATQDDWEPREGAEAMEQALRQAGRAVDFYYYPRAGHWFFEEDRPTDFRQEAAEQAWERTLEFLHFNMAQPASEPARLRQPSSRDRYETVSKGERKMEPSRRLTRSRTNRMLMGVAGGLGEFFGLDATVVRLLFVFAAVFGWLVPAVMAYLVLFLIMPEAPETGGSPLPRTGRREYPPEPIGEIPLEVSAEDVSQTPGPGTTGFERPVEGQPPEYPGE